MLTLIRWLIAYFRRRQEPKPHEEIALLLQTLRAASEADLANILAVALHAKKTLDTTRLVNMPFPTEIFDGALPLDATAVKTLQAYVQGLKRFKAGCIAQGTIMTMSVARGLDVWIATVWSLTLPAITEGKEIWSLLAKGEGGVQDAYRFTIRRDLTDVEQGYLTYRPRILID
jgi:hypothetical protein